MCFQGKSFLLKSKNQVDTKCVFRRSLYTTKTRQRKEIALLRTEMRFPFLVNFFFQFWKFYNGELTFIIKLKICTDEDPLPFNMFRIA